MNDKQKVVAAKFALAVVSVAVLLLAAFALAAPFKGIREGTILGNLFYNIVLDNDGSGIVGPLGFLLTAGLAAGSTLPGSKNYLALTTYIICVGLASSALILYFAAFDGRTGSFISRHSGRDISPDDVRDGTYVFVSWAVAALCAGLVTLFGISNMRGKTE